MSIALNVALALGGVALADWLFFTRVGESFYGEFDYRYWPFSKARIISLSVVMCTAIWMILFGPRPDPVNPPVWVLAPLGLVLIGHIAVGCRDIFIQRQTGYRKPPRYVDHDEY